MRQVLILVFAALFLHRVVFPHLQEFLAEYDKSVEEFVYKLPRNLQNRKTDGTEKIIFRPSAQLNNNVKIHTLPNLMIVGRPHSGISAFGFFLKFHPDFSTNIELVNDTHTYLNDKSTPCTVKGGFECSGEEINFFNDDDKYENAGIEWHCWRVPFIKPLSAHLRFFRF